jgi:DNA-binding MurR/RpiR family transcriptional regulator
VDAHDGFSAAQLGEVSPRDCVVAFTFPRYAASTHRIALWAKEHKASVVAVTDTPISAVGQIADIVLLAASAGTGMQNSLVGPMAVANALLNGIAADKGQAALDHYSRHDKVLNEWDAFLLKLDGTD